MASRLPSERYRARGVNDRIPPLPAGWHPDPWRRYEYRYFNGTTWTGDVSLHGERRLDTINPTLVATGAAPANTAALGGLAVVGGAAVLGLIPYLFVIMAPAVVVGVVLALRGRRAAPAMGGCGRQAAVAALLLTPVALAASTAGFFLTRAVERQAAKTQPVKSTEIRLTTCRVEDGVVKVAGQVVNSNDTPAEVHVIVQVDLSSGDPILLEFDGTRLQPGDTFGFGDNKFTAASLATCHAGGLWRL